MSGDILRSIFLCVDSYEHGVLKGRFYHPGLAGGGGRFESLTEFLLSAENLFDSLNSPQAFTARRSFGRGASAVFLAPTGAEPRKGKCGTFVIRLLYRQHTSWQGYVTWVEGGEEKPFRSVLELILLINSALNAGETDTLPQAGRGEPA